MSKSAHNSIIITDICGSTISNDKMNNLLPFIIIPAHPSLLKEIPNISNIKKIHVQHLLELLQSYNIDPSMFAPIGDAYANNEIILANTKITAKPVGYEKLQKKGNNQDVWVPIPPAGFKPLGYVASTNKPSLDYVRVINESYLKKNGDHYVINVVFKNDDESVWKPDHGKNVTLIESESPWYIDKQKHMPTINIDMNEYIENDDGKPPAIANITIKLIIIFVVCYLIYIYWCSNDNKI